MTPCWSWILTNELPPCTRKVTRRPATVTVTVLSCSSTYCAMASCEKCVGSTLARNGSKPAARSSASFWRRTACWSWEMSWELSLMKPVSVGVAPGAGKWKFLRKGRGKNRAFRPLDPRLRPPYLSAMPPLLAPIIASAGLGALIGLIRQWSEQTEHAGNTDFGGVRTHTLWAILGCLAGAANRDYSPFALPVVVTVVAAHLIVAQGRLAGAASPGSTSFAASLLTLMTGALVAWGHTQTAVVVGALTMVVLGIKQPLHAWTRAFTPADIRGTLQFAAITGVILPLV